MSTPGRKKTKPRAARRAELRDRLLAVVERLLDEGEEYDAISVERIVSLAGISRSTFYVYFQDKSDLLRAWFEGIEESIEHPVGSWLGQPDRSSREELAGWLRRLIAAYQPHARLMAATFDAAAYDPEVAELTDAMMDRQFARMTEHIKAGQDAGRIDPALPPVETATLLGWMSERGFHLFLRDASPQATELLTEAFADVFWNTLYAPVGSKLT